MLVMLLATLGVNVAFGATETVSAVSTDRATYDGTAVTIGNEVMTNSTSSGYVKMRTGNAGNTIVITVKDGFVVTGVSLQAYSNNSAATITLTGVSYNGIAQANFSSVVLPVSGSKPSSPNYTKTGVSVSGGQTIVFSFDNSAITGENNKKNKQMMAKLIFTYEVASTCTKIKPTIAWATDSEPAGGEVGAADVVAAVTTNQAGAAITWESSKPEVATVTNGTIHFVSAGKTTISAKFTGDGETYCPDEVKVEKEIEVKAPFAGLDYGTYTFVGGTSTGSSKKIGVVNNMYFGRSGGSQSISTNGLQTKSSSFIAFKLEKQSEVTFEVVTTKECTGTYEVKALTLAQLEGIKAQQVAGGTETTYFSIAGDVLCTITKAATAAGTYKTNETITLQAGCYWFNNTAANDAFYIKNVIVAAPATKYHVTYAKGEGEVTGSVPTQADLAKGKTFEVAAKGDLARDGYDFAGWNDGSADYAAGDTYTMGTSDVTLTATWTPAIAKFTVKYMDGTTELGTEEVVVGEHPTADGIVTTKAHYTFTGWTPALDAVSGIAGETVTVNAGYTAKYAASVDFTTNVLAEKSSKTLAKFFEDGNHNYTCGGTFSKSEWGTTSEDAAYQGYKFKDKSVWVEFLVPAGKTVVMTFGNYGAKANIKRGSAAAVDMTLTNSEYRFTTTEDEVVRFTTNSGSTNTVTLKSIKIGKFHTISYVDTKEATNPNPVEYEEGVGVAEIVALGDIDGWHFLGWDKTSISAEATEDVTITASWESTLSKDITLSSLKYGETAITTAADKFVYNVTLPYGAAVPTVTAVANHANATVGTITQATVETPTASFWVTAEDGTTKQAYQVRFAWAPKIGIEIIGAMVKGNTSADASGLYLGSVDVKTQSDKKFGSDSYVGLKLEAGKKFATGDVLAIDITTVASGGKIALYASDKSTVLWNTETRGVLGMNYFVLPEALNDKEEFYVCRTNANGWNAFVNTFKVYRAMPAWIESYTIAGVEATIAGSTITAEVPYGTDLAAAKAAAEVVAYANGSAHVAKNADNVTITSDYAEDAPVVYTLAITFGAHYVAEVDGTGYTTLEAAVAAAEGKTVKLLEDIDVTATGLAITGNITLDLNGFNIKAGESATTNIYVTGKLTVEDNSADHNGKIYTEAAYSSANKNGLIRVDGGEFILNSGNIEAVLADAANNGQFGVVAANGAKITINGGQIKAGWYAISANGTDASTITVVVNGGELISTADYAIYQPAKNMTTTIENGVVYGATGAIAANAGVVTVNGGTITSKGQGSTGTWGDGTGGLTNAAININAKYGNTSCEITGGTISAEGDAITLGNGATYTATIAISGGSFSQAVKPEYCAEGFAPKDNGDGTYGVKDMSVVIFDGSTMSDMVASPDEATGLSWAVVGSTMTAGDKNATYQGTSYTRSLSGGNSSATKHFTITIPENKLGKIHFLIMTNSSGSTRSAWLTASTEKGDMANAIVSATSSSYTDLGDATSNWLEEGTYYLHTDNTVNFFVISVQLMNVDPKCEAPVITTQPETNKQFGAGAMTATVVASVEDGGELSYQWYNEADEAVAGATAATLSTETEGKYYVVITNTLADHRDNSVKSEVAELAHRVMNDATLSALTYGAPATAITLVADQYEYNVELAKGTTEVPALDATTNSIYATKVINDATAFVEYAATSTVVVTAEDGVATQTYTVNFTVKHDVDLQPVAASAVWDWKAGVTTNQTAAGNFTDGVLANIEGVVYADAFHAEQIQFTGTWGARHEGTNTDAYRYYMQATQFKMNFAVAGKLVIYYRGTGSDKPATVIVNGETVADAANGVGNKYEAAYPYAVEPGMVTVDLIGENNGPVRICKIEFTEATVEAAEDAHPVTSVDAIATLCSEKDIVAHSGGAFYYVSANNDGALELTEATGVLHAGYPYIYISNGQPVQVVYGEGVATEPKNHNGLYATFVNLPLGDGYALIKNNKYYRTHDGNNNGCYAHHCYIKLDEIAPESMVSTAPGESAPAPVHARRVVLGTNETNTTTDMMNVNDIDNVNKMLLNGELFIIRGGKTFNAAGLLVK